MQTPSMYIVKFSEFSTNEHNEVNDGPGRLAELVMGAN